MAQTGTSLNPMKLPPFFEEDRLAVDAQLEKLLPAESAQPSSIHTAMRYSVFAGGKRVRPILSLECARIFAAAHDTHQRAERVENSRKPVDGGAGRRDAVQQPVQLMVFPHDGLVESFDVRAAVVLRGQDAVMLELDHRLLYRHAG